MPYSSRDRNLMGIELFNVFCNINKLMYMLMNMW